jgi:hypothetical protein
MREDDAGCGSSRNSLVEVKALIVQVIVNAITATEAGRALVHIGIDRRREREATLMAMVEALTRDPVDVEAAIALAFSLKNGKPRQADGNPSPAKSK